MKMAEFLSLYILPLRAASSVIGEFCTQKGSGHGQIVYTYHNKKHYFSYRVIIAFHFLSPEGIFAPLLEGKKIFISV